MGVPREALEVWLDREGTGAESHNTVRLHEYVRVHAAGGSSVWSKGDMETKKPHFAGHRERLRHRFLNTDIDGIAEYEVVELLLCLVVPQRDVKPLAKRLVAGFGSLRGILDAGPKELSKVEGMGKATAENIGALRVILVRYLQERATTTERTLDYKELREYCRVRMGREPVEVFRVFLLNPGLQVLAEEELERGTVDRASVYPRQVMESAMRHRASAVVLVHNHPSGNATPSELDRTLTKTIAMAAAPLDIRVVDHLVVTKDGVFSFQEAGLL